jgi:hypothetical protein
MLQGWKRWLWLIVACPLLIGLMSLPEDLLAAFFLSIGQSMLFFARERGLKALAAEQQGSSPPSARRQTMLKWIKRGPPAKRSSLYSSAGRQEALFAKATLSSSLSSEQKLCWLSAGVWIPYRPL